MGADLSARQPVGYPSGRGRMSALVAEVRRSAVLRVVVRRLLMAVPLLFFVSALTFVLVSLTPGDAARDILGINAPPGAYVRLRHTLGLDQPLYAQYWHWVQHALSGDLGTSVINGSPVTSLISQRLPVTFSLIAGAVLMSVTIGVLVGTYSAVRGDTIGRIIDAFALIGFALPGFWVGAGLIAIFSVKLGWFPVTGYIAPSVSVGEWLKSLTLPVAALSLGGIAAVAKQSREAMLEVLATEHVRMAWANGLSPRSIYFRHALKNASLRVVTVLGVLAVTLLGGTVLVENVFALPGLGSLVVNASLQHDLPVVEGAAVYFTIIVVGINLLIDVAYTWLDPRVKA